MNKDITVTPVLRKSRTGGSFHQTQYHWFSNRLSNAFPISGHALRARNTYKYMKRKRNAIIKDLNVHKSMGFRNVRDAI